MRTEIVYDPESQTSVPLHAIISGDALFRGNRVWFSSCSPVVELGPFRFENWLSTTYALSGSAGRWALAKTRKHPLFPGKTVFVVGQKTC